MTRPAADDGGARPSCQPFRGLCCRPDVRRAGETRRPGARSRCPTVETREPASACCSRRWRSRAWRSPRRRRTSPWCWYLRRTAVRERADADPLRVEPGTAVRASAVFADGRLVCTLERPPFECPWDAGPDVVEHAIRASVLAQGRPPHLAHDPDEGRGLHRDGRRRCRAGDGHRDRRPRPFRPRADARGLPRLRGRRAAAAHGLRGRKRPARDHRRRRRQRQHEGRDADGEAGGQEVPVRAEADRPRHAGGVQRQRVHAGAADRRPRRRASRPSIGSPPWGGTALYDVIVKSIDQLGPPDRPPRARRLHRRRRPQQPRRRPRPPSGGSNRATPCSTRSARAARRGSRR